jgi:hypothetical protein
VKAEVNVDAQVSQRQPLTPPLHIHAPSSTSSVIRHVESSAISLTSGEPRQKMATGRPDSVSSVARYDIAQRPMAKHYTSNPSVDGSLPVAADKPNHIVVSNLSNSSIPWKSGLSSSITTKKRHSSTHVASKVPYTLSEHSGRRAASDSSRLATARRAQRQ